MPADVKADVVIVGAGFGGSLAALVLDRIGLRVVLVDRGSHPRFAIGESSTPTADFVLRELACRYELPRIQPLASYGAWKAAHPQVMCGRKRGFSYFRHAPGEAFAPRADHANELLVAASSDDFHSDTHWLRSDVDAFLAREVQAAGIPYFDRTSLAVHEHAPVWRLSGAREGEAVRMEARFLLDATGEGGFVPRALGIANGPGKLKTHSRACFAHFEGVRPWGDVLGERGARVEDHPFPCDAAAQHHVLEEGWMWQLRFDNGVTSAGFALDLRRCGADPARSPQAEWERLLRRYPSLETQFGSARVVQPEGGLRQTGRLQRRAARIAGANWALAPHTAGFIDPLHSTGIAHTLCGVERLAWILERHAGRDSLPQELHRYAAAVEREIAFIDELVDGCYQALANFDLFVTFSMLYFAAATTYESRRVAGQLPPGAPLLCADDPQLRAAASQMRRQLDEALAAADPTAAAARFQERMAQAIAPFNTAGLCDPSVANMYRYTAARGGPR